MSVKSYRRGRFQKLPVECAQNSDIVVAASGRYNDATVAVNHLQKLANDQRHCLNSLDLLLSTQQLPLQASLLFFDVFLLQLVVILQLVVKCGRGQLDDAFSVKARAEEQKLQSAKLSGMLMTDQKLAVVHLYLVELQLSLKRLQACVQIFFRLGGLCRRVHFHVHQGGCVTCELYGLPFSHRRSHAAGCRFNSLLQPSRFWAPMWATDRVSAKTGMHGYCSRVVWSSSSQVVWGNQSKYLCTNKVGEISQIFCTQPTYKVCFHLRIDLQVHFC